MDNSQILYQLYLQQLAQNEQGNSIDKLKSYSSKLNNFGNNLSTVGNTIKDNVDSEVAKKLGSSISKIGGNLSNGASSLSNTLNAPQNYYKGFANRTLGTGLQNVGKALAGQTGAIGTIGNVLSNTGATMAGTTAAGTGAATAGTAATTGTTAAGTAAGTTAATGAATTGAATGAAAGSGAAAGGSAASGAAMSNPVTALIALGVMAAMGANRKRAKKSGQALMQATNQMAEAGNQESEQRLAATQQSTQALQDMANQSLMNGVMTGGAANIQNPDGSIDTFPTTKSAFSNSLKNVGWDDKTINSALNGLNLGNKEMSDYINAYNQTAADGQQIIIPKTQEEIEKARMLADGTNPQQQGNVQTTEQVKQGLLDKFINGITDFSRGYQENRNTAFSPENLKADKFADTRTIPNETLVNYQNNLRNQGVDENIVNAVAQGKNSGNKDIANWINNNQEAYQPQTETVYKDKSKMGRLGEAVGTISRIAHNPATQAIVAGGLSTALTGNPLYGAGMAYKFGNQRQMSNIYQDVLAKNGVDVDTGLFGNITSSDMNALMTPKYKEALNNIALAKLQETQNYHDLMMKYYNDKLEETKKNNAEKIAVANKNANARQTSANASVVRANKTGTGKGKTVKPQDNPEWNNDLAGFTQIVTNPRYANKAGEAKARFIKKYGVDPMKYVKL